MSANPNPHDIHSHDHQASNALSVWPAPFTHCSLSLLTFCNLRPIHPLELPFSRIRPVLVVASLAPVQPGGQAWLGGLAWTAGFQPLPHLTPNAPLLHSPRPHTHQENTISVALLGWGSMHRSPAQAATAQSLRCPRMPSREPQRRLACRHRGTHLPRHPRGMGGLWPGDPNGIERDDLASARGCPEPRGQPGGTKSKRKRYK